MRPSLPVLAVLCLAVAACADDDDAADPAVTADRTTVETAGASSTTGPATTSTDDAPTTTRQPTTTPPSSSTAPPTTSTAPATTAPYVSELYSDPAHWICRPDAADLCDSDLDITDVAPDGSTTVRPFVAATDPPVDCFYVYPTTSEDLTVNSDLIPGNELLATRVQAARFSQVCGVYAPVYRSMTISATVAALLNPPGDFEEAYATAYADVVDAWRHYLANDNHGRGVILIGHSQGTAHLLRLLHEEIDPSDDERSLLVGAYLLGNGVGVPVGADVGGDLQEIPLCRSFDQTGCVVTYATFRSTAPPPEDAYFGRPISGNGMAGCVNPAAPGGGEAELDSAFVSNNRALSDGSLTPATPFMNFPGFITAECKYENGFSYLELTLHPDPSDPRADDLTGADLTPQWGTHLIDVNVASGNLIAMAQQQIDAYVAAHR